MTPSTRIRIVSSLAELDPAAWDACANPSAPPLPIPLPQSCASVDRSGERHNPFLAHAFLQALERSGCVSPRAGWTPAHVCVESAGRLMACAPTYAKTHSQGEYVFDHAWADAFERAGGRYYPKIQIAVPFTPVTGRRFLVNAEADRPSALNALVSGLRSLRETLKASSIHSTFVTRSESEELAQHGFLCRTDQQFHFLNEGYGSFDDFLASLASRKRKAIRRERKDALAHDITIERLTGSALREEHWDAFFGFYMDTGSRKWGRPYLNRRFFSLIGEAMPERILLVMARRGGRYVAGALNFIGDDAIYGRNWGAIEEHPFLHFEVCYYQAIDFAIEHGLARVEAGAQGEHKLARGYRPSQTHSVHDIADPRLARAIADYLRQERRYVDNAIEVYGEHTPFRRDPAALPPGEPDR